MSVAFWPAMGSMLPLLVVLGAAWGLSGGNVMIAAVARLLGMLPYALLHPYAVPLVER